MLSPIPTQPPLQGENGIAVKLGTEGNKALTKSTEEVLGSVKPYSITGSLPLVRYLQDNDFDVQLCGYGLSSRSVTPSVRHEHWEVTREVTKGKAPDETERSQGPEPGIGMTARRVPFP